MIGKINCYLIDGLGLTVDNKVKEIARMTPEEYQYVIPTRCYEQNNDDRPIEVFKFPLSIIRNIEKRRYLLQERFRIYYCGFGLSGQITNYINKNF